MVELIQPIWNSSVQR